MVGVTYRSASARPQAGFRPPPLPELPAKQQSDIVPPTFKDKESYQQLFKPLPKPEPPPPLVPFKCEVKSWSQLQQEREAMMSAELNKTKDEAMSMWNRTKEDDEKRVGAINEEKRRIEEEYRAREEIMRRGNEERRIEEENRTKEDDEKRVGAINEEKRRIEE